MKVYISCFNPQNLSCGLWWIVSGVDPVTGCRAFGRTELEARDVCGVRGAASLERGFCRLGKWEGEEAQKM